MRGRPPSDTECRAGRLEEEGSDTESQPAGELFQPGGFASNFELDPILPYSRPHE